jgi:sigma-B regulation protein RsbU (phosphoserine phosphatase)
LRFRVLAAVWFAVCGAMPLLAQAPTPAPSAAAPVRPHGRAKTAPPAPSAPQAIFDATSLGSPLQLQSDWHVGITSDPAASSPSFDDSNWAIRNAQAFMSDVPDNEDEGSAPAAQSESGSTANPATKAGSQRYAWFRLHIKLAPNHGPVALLIELPVSTNTSFGLGSTGPSPDIYANGRHIQPEGPHGDAPQHYQLISRIYNLNVPPNQTSLTLVVRIYYTAFGYGAYTTFFANRTFYLGNPGDLARELNLWSNRSLFERLPRLIYSVLLAILAIFLFALYLAQKGRTEYLWLALHELVQAPLGFIELAGSSARLDTLWYAALVLELILVSAYLFFEFLVIFLSLPRPWYTRWLRYTAPALAAVGPALLLVGHSTTVAILLVSVLIMSGVWMLSWAIFVFITLFAAAVRRNLEAGLWLIPLILSVIGFIEPIVTSVISDETGAVYRSRLTIDAGPIPIHMSSVGDFAGIFVILLIIYLRFMHIYRDQEHAASELAAARSVQELLIPREKIATPGFEVDSVYCPANEVGGDFFHLQSAGLDGMLVVIGDVAGKGLKAAMNVSLLMGALRRTREHSPAKILESLNGVLTGTESFTTCQAIWLASNGEMVIANAGHLSPYLNSQEINLPGALPLGVLPQVSYEEERFYLHPGDRILLLSDGVVEARKPSGELFGFDRVRYLSNQSAFYLADAAKAFGQEDDITVLTVRRQVQVLAA